MDPSTTGTLASDGIELHRIGPGTPRAFAVLGERCSGTNLVTRLIRRHTALGESRQLGWKHGFVQTMGIAPDLVVVGCVRNALDWVASLHAKPWHATPHMQALTFSQFIRAPWDSILDQQRYFQGLHQDAIGQPLQQDRHPISGDAFANILQLRRTKAASLLGLRQRQCHLCLVQMEQVQRDPEQFVAQFSRALGLPAPAPYQPITRRLGSRFRPAAPSRPTAPDPWPAADMEFVLGQLDRDQEAELGYAYPQPDG